MTEALECWPAGVEAAALYAQLHALSFPDPWPDADFARLLASSGVDGLILRRGEAPLGLSLIRSIAGECEILTIGISPAKRRSGLGRVLLKGSEDQARHRGSKRMILEVSVSNAPAQALYKASGYRQIGIRKAYYRDGSAAQVLAKDLV